MAPRQLLNAAAAFAAASGALAAEPTLLARIEAAECWDTGLAAEETYYPTTFQAHSESSAADLFDIAYADTFKVVTSKMSKEQYVLTLCGQAQPSDSEVNAVAALDTGYSRKHFSVPVQSAMAMSTVQLGFLDALGVQDRVNFLGSSASAPCWQKALECGSVMEESWATDYDATNADVQKASVDVVFVDCGTDCSNVHALANGVHVPATQDSGNLATAEYVKYIAAFFNKEPLANELFATTETNYEQAGSGATTTPVVAWISYTEYGGPSWDRKQFQVSQATYKMGYVADVGAANLDAAADLAAVPGLDVADAVWSNPAAGKTYSVPLEAFNGSASNTAADVKSNASAYFMAALAGVDVVIDETYAWDTASYDFDSFLSTFGLSSDSTMKFVQNQMVLRYDRTLSASKGWDWLESRIAKPDWALEGLAYTMYGDVSKRAKYFRNIAKGEAVDQVLTADMCLEALPVCVAEEEPESIPMVGPVDNTENGSNNDSDISGAATVCPAAAAAAALAALAALVVA